MTRLLLHLDAAYNLARWLTRNELDAEDVVQEAYLRAFSYFATFRGGDGRAWLLTIVRNSYYDWLKQNRSHGPMALFDEELHGLRPETPSQETLMVDKQREYILRQAIDDLPVQYREVLVLREMDGLCYQEIANKVRVPIGTVMSRLSRARKRLQKDLVGQEVPGSRCTRDLPGLSADRQELSSCVGCSGLSFDLGPYREHVIVSPPSDLGH
jgi:RNA polymerase sigma-70 factor (ECF subfamily)